MAYFTKSKSKIFLYFCLSFVFGVGIASFVKFDNLFLLLLLTLAIILTAVFWRNKKIVIAGLLIIFAIAGIYRYQSVADNSTAVKNFNDTNKNIAFQGIISEEPDVRIKDTRYVVANRDFGRILVSLPHYPAYQYGDLVEFEGKLKEPVEFASFDYKAYLAKDDIFLTMYSPKTKLISSGKASLIYGFIFRLKDKFREKLKTAIAEPESALANGLLLGDRSMMTEKLKNDFAATGTSHIVAVSGFNVTIIAVIILEVALFVGFSRSQSFWVSLVAIVLFIIMVGAPASAVRAGIMGGLLLLAIKTGRLNSSFNAIVFAAILMVAANPKILRFDVGFLLSFLAVAGIVWLYPILDCFFRKFPDTLKIKSVFLLTLSAQIMTLPVLIYNFDRFSLVAPLANILILPFIPLAMVLGFFSGIFGFIHLALAKAFGYFAWLILTYQLRTIEYLASFPLAAIKITNFNIVFAIFYYLVIFAVLFFNLRRVKLNASEQP